MNFGEKISTSKALWLIFMGFSLIAALLAAAEFVNCFGSPPNIKGWVHYGSRLIQPEILSIGNAQVKIFPMSRMEFAMVQFNRLSDLFSGIPLVYFVLKATIDVSTIIVFYQMALIFRSLSKAEAFRVNNEKRLFTIAIAVLGFSLLHFINARLLSFYISQSKEGLTQVYPFMGIEKLGLGLLTAMIILALLKAFQLGTQLQQEQDLTI